MNRKLCEDDPKTTEFTANIIEATSDSKGWKVQLDQTYFYPEGGGQPSDRGWINEIEVTDVQEKEGHIFHYTKGEPVEEQVTCRIDKERRLEFMQQHTGQHIISSALWQVGNYSTVSVHMGEAHTTIELDKPAIPIGELLEAEKLANRIINRNLPVRIIWTDASKLGNYNLRKPVTVEGKIRLVCIEGIDCVGCCGLHLEHTGDVGLVKYIQKETIRGHVRISWKIGGRAYEDYHRKVSFHQTLKTLLSTCEEGFEEKIRQLQDEVQERSQQNSQMENRLVKILANDLLEKEHQKRDEGRRVITGIFINEGANRLKKIAKELMEHKNTVFCLVNKTSKKLTWIMGCSEDLTLPFDRIQKECLSLIDGKGGGRHPLWQGMGNPKADTKTFFKSFKKLLS